MRRRTGRTIPTAARSSIGATDSPALVRSFPDPTNGGYCVFGTHTYTTASLVGRTQPLTFTVHVTDAASNTSSATGTANVLEPAVNLTGVATVINAVRNTQIPAPVTVATFTDPAGADLTPGAYAALINWGDGTPADSGTVIPTDPANGIFTVTAPSHIYASSQAGAPYTVTVTVNHLTSQGSTIQDSAVVSDPPLLITGGLIRQCGSAGPTSPR